MNKKIFAYILSMLACLSLAIGCDKDENTTTVTDDTTTEEITSIQPVETLNTDVVSQGTATGDEDNYSIEVESIKDGEMLPAIKDPRLLVADLDSCLKINEDTIGWIKIPGTVVNQPIVQGDDDKYYLDHDINHKKYVCGTLFASCANKVLGNRDDNIILYGHNVGNGTYFGSLNLYKNLDFYKRAPLIQFNTLDDKSNYVIISVFMTNVEYDQDNGKRFNYHKYLNFNSSNFLTWRNEITKRSLFTSEFDYNSNDDFITCSTCCHTYPNARLVVIARKIREGESIDVNNIEYNKNTYFPASWDKNKFPNNH